MRCVKRSVSQQFANCRMWKWSAGHASYMSTLRRWAIRSFGVGYYFVISLKH